MLKELARRLELRMLCSTTYDNRKSNCDLPHERFGGEIQKVGNNETRKGPLQNARDNGEATTEARDKGRKSEKSDGVGWRCGSGSTEVGDVTAAELPRDVVLIKLSKIAELFRKTLV